MNEKYTSQEQRVVDVFNRHYAAFMSANIDAILADFGDDSVVITPEGVFAGRDRIRLVYNALLAEFGNISRQDSPGFNIEHLHVHGDTLFITWKATSKQHTFPFGTDTFVCDGEKFTRQSIAFGQPKPRLTA